MDSRIYVQSFKNILSTTRVLFAVIFIITFNVYSYIGKGENKQFAA